MIADGDLVRPRRDCPPGGAEGGALAWLREMDNLGWRPASLLYASHGWAVFPCGGKVPLTTHGCKDATTDEGQIRQWWDRWPTASIGWAVPSTVVVIDIDPRHAGDESLAQLERENGALPPTLRARTGGGGEHRVYRLPPGVAVRNRANVRPGVDTRSSGGFVIVAPSVHASGLAYRWVDYTRPVVAPSWLVELVAPPKPQPAPYTPPATVSSAHLGQRERYARGVLKGVVSDVTRAAEGERNVTLRHAWWRILGFRDALPESEARAELAAAARSIGLGDLEIAHVLR